MIFYRPTDGDVNMAPVSWRPRTCFLMAAMGKPVPAEVRSVRRRVIAALRRANFRTVDAASATTGKDFLVKIWALAVSCPVGIAIVHEGIRPETMANIFYELGLMQAYGRETVVIKIGKVKLPSDLGMRCKDYLKARKCSERLSLSGEPEQTLDELRLPCRVSAI